MQKSSAETNPDRVRELAYEHPPHPTSDNASPRHDA